MDLEKFKSDYESKSILEIYDSIKYVFENKLIEVFKEDDIGKLASEIQNTYVINKEFDKALEFNKIIKNNYSELYEDYSYYFNDFLIEYYCYNKLKEELPSLLDNFISKAYKSNALFDKNIKTLLYYGYSELINKISYLELESLKYKDEYVMITSYFICKMKYFIILDEIYKNFTVNSKVDAENYRKDFRDSGFELDDNYIYLINKSISEEEINIKKIVYQLDKNLEGTLFSLSIHFMKYMIKKGISFEISGSLWEDFSLIWRILYDQKKNNLKNFFDLKYEVLSTNVMINLSSTKCNKPQETFFMTWGSRYIYDFLKEKNIINKETYNNLSNIQLKLIGQLLKSFESSLWNISFILDYPKPDSLEQKDYDFLKKLITENYESKDPIDFRNTISQNVKNMNEKILEGLSDDTAMISTDFIDSVKGNQEYYNKDSNSTNSQVESNNTESDRNQLLEILELVNTNKSNTKSTIKVGRNEPCICGSGKKYKKCCGN
ncbi:MAG: SEC-C metal-binding domain-containing protein [Candidatus Sericytochromatia bacterium]